MDSQSTEAAAEGTEEMQKFLKREPIVSPPKIGRNQLCPCGSKKKYKKCCWAAAFKQMEDQRLQQEQMKEVLDRVNKKEVVETTKQETEAVPE